MGVNVDETGQHPLAPRVDDAAGARFVHRLLGHTHHAPRLHAQVAHGGSGAETVEPAPVFDDHVVAHG